MVKKKGFTFTQWRKGRLQTGYILIPIGIFLLMLGPFVNGLSKIEQAAGIIFGIIFIVFGFWAIQESKKL